MHSCSRCRTLPFPVACLYDKLPVPDNKLNISRARAVIFQLKRNFPSSIVTEAVVQATPAGGGGGQARKKNRAARRRDDDDGDHHEDSSDSDEDSSGIKKRKRKVKHQRKRGPRAPTAYLLYSQHKRTEMADTLPAGKGEAMKVIGTAWTAASDDEKNK